MHWGFSLLKFQHGGNRDAEREREREREKREISQGSGTAALRKVAVAVRFLLL